MSTDSSTEWSSVCVIVNRKIRQKEKEKQQTEAVSNAIYSIFVTIIIGCDSVWIGCDRLKKKEIKN